MKRVLRNRVREAKAVSGKIQGALTKEVDKK